MAYGLELGMLAHLAHLEAEVEEEAVVANYTLQRRLVRDNCDPFNAPTKLFKQNFRVSKDIARDLIDRLGHRFPATRASALTPTYRVLAALKCFAKGSYQRGSVAEHNAVNMCQASVSNSLHIVMNAILTELGPEIIQFPRTAAARAAVKQGFFHKFGLPGVIGAIDCTLISIVPPHLNEEQYFCRKKCHCINTQIICDSDLRILNVNVRHGGATNDAYVWQHSIIYPEVERLVMVDGETYTRLIGDSGYPLTPFLLTPIVGADPETPAGRYTRAHVLSRNCIERVNGVVKAKWRCIRKDRVLHYTPQTAKNIIKRIAILHNIALRAMPDYLDDVEDEPPLPEPEEEIEDNDYYHLGIQVRHQLIAARFT